MFSVSIATAHHARRLDPTVCTCAIQTPSDSPSPAFATLNIHHPTASTTSPFNHAFLTVTQKQQTETECTLYTRTWGTQHGSILTVGAVVAAPGTFLALGDVALRATAAHFVQPDASVGVQRRVVAALHAACSDAVNTWWRVRGDTLTRADEGDDVLTRRDKCGEIR